MALSSRGALEKFKTTGVPLKTVTAPSWALIWTLTKAYFTISWSCWAYNRAGGIWCKPVAWMACKIAFHFRNSMWFFWIGVQSLILPIPNYPGADYPVCGLASPLAFTWAHFFLLPARTPPNHHWAMRQCNSKPVILNDRWIPPNPTEDICQDIRLFLVIKTPRHLVGRRQRYCSTAHDVQGSSPQLSISMSIVLWLRNWALNPKSDGEKMVFIKSMILGIWKGWNSDTATYYLCKLPA